VSKALNFSGSKSRKKRINAKREDRKSEDSFLFGIVTVYESRSFFAVSINSLNSKGLE
jgi:hypothetical protein